MTWLTHHIGTCAEATTQQQCNQALLSLLITNYIQLLAHTEKLAQRRAASECSGGDDDGAAVVPAKHAARMQRKKINEQTASSAIDNECSSIHRSTEASDTRLDGIDRITATLQPIVDLARYLLSLRDEPAHR